MLHDGASADAFLKVAPRPPAPYAGSARRWVVLLVFSLGTMSSAFMWLQLASTYQLAGDVLAASANEINMVSQVFLVAYLPASLLAMVLMEGKGTRPTLVLGLFLNAACGAVKWGGSLLVGRRAYVVVLFGQVLGALGQPLILNLSARIAADWFTEAERDLATVALTMANVLGQALASFLPPLVVTDAAGMRNLLLAAAVPAVVAFLLALLLLPERPNDPPSASAEQQWAVTDAARATAAAAAGGRSITVAAHALAAVARDTRLLLRDSNFCWLLASFSIAVGMGWSLLTVEGQLITPCGYDATVAGNSGAALLGVGMLCSFAVGPLLQRYKRYALSQKLAMAAAAASVAFVLAANRPGSAGLVYAAWCSAGAVLMPLLPLSLEHAAEATFPVSADASSAVLLTGANVVGMCLIFALGPMLQLPASAACSSIITPAAGLVFAFMLVGVILALPLRHVWKRKAAETASLTATATLVSGDHYCHDDGLRSEVATVASVAATLTSVPVGGLALVQPPASAMTSVNSASGPGPHV